MDNSNLLLAIILSIAILVGFQYLYVKPQQQHAQQRAIAEHQVEGTKVGNNVNPPTVLRDRAEVLKDDPRLPIATAELKGSINLKGARIDDLALVSYRETVDSGSPPVTLLSPSGSEQPNNTYYAAFRWLADGATPVPALDTVWTTSDKWLQTGHPVKLIWNNGEGLVFERTISIDDQYMFTVADNVRNTGTTPVTLYPSGLITRQGNPFGNAAAASGRNAAAANGRKPSYILHEGPMGVLDGTLQEFTYKKLMDDVKKTFDSTGGWLGITDKYWLVAMVIPEGEKVSADFIYDSTGQLDPTLGYFQTDFRGAPLTVAPGASADHTTMLFAGAKRQKLLEHYRDEYKIPLFDRAIDFGWFWFLTIPFLHLVGYLTQTLGSFALAILVFTVVLKLFTLPLSLKSNHSMSKMKKLQPEIQRVKDRYQDDKVKQSHELMELYKREGINPLAGCVPTLIQIPIFFALYKVIYVGIEMRQAPFYGWIKDLSVPDPSSIFTLGGLISWTPPEMFHIGVWPLLMGCSMFLQQRMSPQPPDKSQARMFMFMPIVFTYMLRSMPAGLVIYWTWSNLLSVLQQWYIMRQDLSRKSNKA